MSDTEKLTINIGAVDLGKIDLLVGEGVYSNRTDFLRSAIRTQIDKHHLEIHQSVTRYAFLIGILRYDRKSLEHMRDTGKRIKVTVIGMLTVAKDVPAELAAEVIESVRLHGVFRASDAVKAALADRIQGGS